MVIIDTSVWIPCLEMARSPESLEVGRLVSSGQAAIVGIVMTEVLRGARTLERLGELHDQLLAATFLEAEERHWRLAGEILLDLRLKGQTIPLADAIIAAQAIEGEHLVYSLDAHFTRVPGLQLYEAGSL